MNRMTLALLCGGFLLTACSSEPVTDQLEPASVTTPADVGQGVELGGRLGQTGERG